MRSLLQDRDMARVEDKALLPTAWATGDSCPPVLAGSRQPAAWFLRRSGDSTYRIFRLDVIRVARAAVAEFAIFDARLFPVSTFP
jgi:RNA polymerase sigma-70 factor (ECF subfamily)